MAGRKPIPKSQKQISKDLQTPYTNPDTGVPFNNPNDNTLDLSNRGNQVSFKGDTVKPFTLGFKDIDEAIFYYFDEVIKPRVQQNGVSQKVPVIYGSPERWKQVQRDGFYRDDKGKIMMPLITFKRNTITKNRLTSKIDANNPNNFQIFSKTNTRKNAYDNFAVLNNRIPQKSFYAVVVPDYVTITYDFIIATYYIEQLNKLIEAVNYASDSYWGDPERFKFKAMIDSFATPVELQTGNQRTVRANFTLNLYGYLVPDNVQKQLSSLKKYSNKTNVVFNFEMIDSPRGTFKIPQPSSPASFPEGAVTGSEPPSGFAYNLAFSNAFDSGNV